MIVRIPGYMKADEAGVLWRKRAVINEDFLAQGRQTSHIHTRQGSSWTSGTQNNTEIRESPGIVPNRYFGVSQNQLQTLSNLTVPTTKLHTTHRPRVECSQL